MTLADIVHERLLALDAEVSLNAALLDAERLADQFANVRPTPYAVPIERYVGMTVECRFRQQSDVEEAHA